MIVKSLANTYAEAFMGRLRPEQYHDAVGNIGSFAGIYENDERLQIILGSPAIPAVEKRQTLEAIAIQSGYLEESANFIRLLYENGRLGIVRHVLNSCLELLKEHEGRIDAKVTSAVELSNEQLNNLRLKLCQYTGKQVEMTVTVDPALIGGTVIRLGDKVIDASVAHALEKLRESFI